MRAIHATKLFWSEVETYNCIPTISTVQYKKTMRHPYSINPLGYDRRHTQLIGVSSLKYEVQTPLLFGQFIHDFFWANRNIVIMLIWAKLYGGWAKAKPWRRDSPVVLIN